MMNLPDVNVLIPIKMVEEIADHLGELYTYGVYNESEKEELDTLQGQLYAFVEEIKRQQRAGELE